MARQIYTLGRVRAFGSGSLSRLGLVVLAASAGCERNDGESRSAAAPVDTTDPDGSGSSAAGDSANPPADEAPQLARDAAPAAAAASVSEERLGVCSAGEQCVVVAYAHCCGSTKRAINAAYMDEYKAHPEWQTFNDPEACAVIGQCRPDEDAMSAKCSSGRCELVFP